MGRVLFKFRCVDCGAGQRFSRIEAARQSKPRCCECGSTFLEPKTEKCLERMSAGQSGHNEQLDLMKKKVGLPPRVKSRQRLIGST